MADKDYYQNQTDNQNDKKNRWWPLLLPIFFFLGWVGSNAAERNANQASCNTNGNSNTSINSK